MSTPDEETAKAVREVARAGGKLIDGMAKLGEFFSRLVGPAAEQYGGALGDLARFHRSTVLLRIFDKWEAIIRARNLEGKTVPIPLKYVIPALEKAAWEDDETLQEMWARLLANAADPEKRLQLKRVFAEVLSSLEPLDVQVLRFMSGQGWLMFCNVPGGGITLEALAQATSAPKADVQVALQNLHRLGLIVDEFRGRDDTDPFYQPHAEFGTTSFGVRLVEPGTTFRPSPLGFALLKACEP
jgi:phosphoglycolate phosphatase-like HAD superfamily hydrolase